MSWGLVTSPGLLLPPRGVALVEVFHLRVEGVDLLVREQRTTGGLERSLHQPLPQSRADDERGEERIQRDT